MFAGLHTVLRLKSFKVRMKTFQLVNMAQEIPSLYQASHKCYISKLVPLFLTILYVHMSVHKHAHARARVCVCV
jgi:hypothetical protein